MSPEFPPELVPTTVSEEIANGPSDMAVQFGPRPPLARAKLSVTAFDVFREAEQAIAILVTLADPTVPDPLETVHCCPLGLVATVAL